MVVLCCFSLQNATAQCGVGETEVTIVINTGGFGSEVGWELYDGSMNPVAQGGCGLETYSSNTDAVATEVLCLTNGETYTFNGYDEFGDGWNGGTVDIFVGGCPLIFVDTGTELDGTVPAEATICAGEELEYQGTFAPDDAPSAVNGCTDASADNYDSCATDDNGSCFFNDFCSSAETIECGETKKGDTSLATADTAPFCVTSDGTGGGVWYKFTGAGDEMTASLCNTGFDTKIRIYTGTCGALVCETGNDDNCGTRSEVTWTAAEGTEYYILVHGFSTNQGSFELNLTSPACIFGCTDSEAINYDSAANQEDGSCYFTCYDIEVSVTNTDTFGSEAGWELVMDDGTVFASDCGVPNSGNETNTYCIPATCFNFNAFDSFGDGGNDFVVTLLETGVELVNVTADGVEETGSNVQGSCSQGGSGNVDETAEFCIEPGCADPTAHNYSATADVDDGSCETCDDGELNGDEIDTDCGGVLCTPCPCGIQVSTEVAAYESGCAAGPKNRAVIVTFTEGIPPISYAVDAQGGSFISQKSPGVFQVIGYGPWSIEASDPSGCLQIGASSEMVYVSNVNTQNETGVGVKDGVATVEVTGGTPPYDVMWPNGVHGVITTSGGTHDNTGLASGYYEALVTDADGGTAKACVYVSRNSPSGRGRGRGRKTADVTELSTLMAQPNPLTHSTVIHFNVPESTKTTVSVFALNGKEIATIFDGQAEAGENYHVELNASNMASGVYILRLTTDSGVITHQRIVVTK